MKKIYKKDTKVTIYAIIILMIAAFLLINFADNDNVYYFAVFLLASSMALLTWAQHFYKIESLKLSIILTTITASSMILSMHIADYLGILQKSGSNAGIGVITSQVVAGILIKNLKSIEKILNKYFIK